MTTKPAYHFDIAIPNVGDLAIEGKIESLANENLLELFLIFTPINANKKKTVLLVKLNNLGQFVVENIDDELENDTFDGEGIS